VFVHHKKLSDEHITTERYDQKKGRVGGGISLIVLEKLSTLILT
jgi:hypothetical protein